MRGVEDLEGCEGGMRAWKAAWIEEKRRDAVRKVLGSEPENVERHC
jgi:hypothetical protein